MAAGWCNPPTRPAHFPYSSPFAVVYLGGRGASSHLGRLRRDTPDLGPRVRAGDRSAGAISGHEHHPLEETRQTCTPKDRCLSGWIVSKGDRDSWDVWLDVHTGEGRLRRWAD